MRDSLFILKDAYDLLKKDDTEWCKDPPQWIRENCMCVGGAVMNVINDDVTITMSFKEDETDAWEKCVQHLCPKNGSFPAYNRRFETKEAILADMARVLRSKGINVR